MSVRRSRLDRVRESERRRLLRTFDELTSRIPTRPAVEVDRELAAIRKQRRSGGRRTKGD